MSVRHSWPRSVSWPFHGTPSPVSISAKTRCGFDAEMATATLPTGLVGSPRPCSRVQVTPPSREVNRPLPGPPLSRPQVWISSVHIPANRIARVLRIHGDVRAAGVLVGEERLGPRLPAVGGPEYAALLLRPVGVAERTRQDDVRILRVDHQARNPPGLLQAHQRPGLAGVHGLVDALAQRDVTADLALAGPGPDDVRIGGGDGERPDRLHRLAVEDRRPIGAAVGGLPDAARGGADVIGVGIAGDARGGGEAVALRADGPPVQPAVLLGARAGPRLRRGRHQCDTRQQQRQPRRSCQSHRSSLARCPDPPPDAAGRRRVACRSETHEFYFARQGCASPIVGVRASSASAPSRGAAARAGPGIRSGPSATPRRRALRTSRRTGSPRRPLS